MDFHACDEFTLANDFVRTFRRIRSIEARQAIRKPMVRMSGASQGCKGGPTWVARPQPASRQVDGLLGHLTECGEFSAKDADQPRHAVHRLVVKDVVGAG
jgi:hypothetical protein